MESCKIERYQVNSIFEFCKTMGLPLPANSLVGVFDMSASTASLPADYQIDYGVYALFLKQTKCGDLVYGKRTYDYQEGTITSFAPGQTVTARNTISRFRAQAVVFHPDAIKGTALGQTIGQYSFFSYKSNEALHISDEEKALFVECLQKIKEEAERPADRFSQKLISRNIELLLDYCMRFYARQFDTRAGGGDNVIIKFEENLNSYFEKGMPVRNGLPTVKYFADLACLSPNYFGDMMKRETGKTPQEHIQNKVLDLAKEEILGSDKPIKEIAFDLGFQYSQHFNQFFKRNVGQTPTQYRKLGVA